MKFIAENGLIVEDMIYRKLMTMMCKAKCCTNEHVGEYPKKDENILYANDVEQRVRLEQVPFLLF